MSCSSSRWHDFDLLLDRVLDGLYTEEDARQLNDILRADLDACRRYVGYLKLHGRLTWGDGLKAGSDRGVAGPPAIEEDSGFGVQGSEFGVRGPENAHSKSQIPNQQISYPDSPAPPIILDLSTSLPSSLSPLPSFVGGPVFSYMVATVIVGMMLLGAWAYKITHYHQMVDLSSPSVPSSNRPEMQFVGQITGMVDCRWSDPQTETYPGASVPLGRRYALASGLMEITYKSGAKVILEGPCTYEVESRAGGYLALGKLTARVVSGQWPVASAKPQAANSKSLNPQIPKPPNPHTSNPQSPIPNPLFFVRTPTAIVTDLGTEFGVEVSEDGNTLSHVFRGSVKVQVVGGDVQREGVILRENESARVEKRSGKPSITRSGVGEASGFVLAMPPPKSVRDNEAYAELVLSLNPVVYYHMEKPKNEKDRHQVFDLSGGGHHGELRLGNEFGSPYLPGRFGDALWLRGPAVCDRVVVPDYPKTTNDQLTVSAWVLAVDRPGWAMIAANWGAAVDRTGQFHFGLYRRDGDLATCMTQRDGQRVEVREGNVQPLPLGVWQHVALVADGTTLHLYRNGKEVASGPCVGVLPQPPTASLGIGCRTNAAGTDAMPDTPGYNYWQGRIDELAIFNRALSAQQIEQLYLGKAQDRAAEVTTRKETKK